MKISFSLKDALGIAVSVVFLALIFRNINFTLLAGNLHTMNMPAYLLCLAGHVAVVYVLSKRWLLLFGQEGRGKTLSGAPSYWLGNFYNNLLPGRMGDAVKVYHFSIKHHIPYKNTIAALIVEKFLDVQILACFALLYVAFFRLQVPMVNWMLGGIVAVVIAGDAVLIILAQKKTVLKKSLALLPLPKARRWLFRVFLLVTEKLKYLLRARKMLPFMLVALGIYLAGIFTFYLLMCAAGLQLQFADLSTCLAFPAFFLVIHFIPSAPSSVGVVHYGIYKALLLVASAKGIEMTPALENRIIFSTFLFHFVYFLPETLIGSYYMLRERRVLFDTKKENMQQPEMFPAA